MTQSIEVGGVGARRQWPTAVPFDGASNHVDSAGGASAVLTLAANATKPYILRQIFASYSAAPAAGVYVQVQDGSTVVFKQFLGTTGGSFTFDPPLSGTPNTAMVITVSAGGGAVVAVLDANVYLET